MKPTIIPTLRYNDAQSAIKWLCDAFGSEEHSTAEDYGGKIYSCRDPDGYLRNIGSYDPWADT